MWLIFAYRQMKLKYNNKIVFAKQMYASDKSYQTILCDWFSQLYEASP